MVSLNINKKIDVGQINRSLNLFCLFSNYSSSILNFKVETIILKI